MRGSASIPQIPTNENNALILEDLWNLDDAATNEGAVYLDVCPVLLFIRLFISSSSSSLVVFKCRRSGDSHLRIVRLEDEIRAGMMLLLCERAQSVLNGSISALKVYG